MAQTDLWRALAPLIVHQTLRVESVETTGDEVFLHLQILGDPGEPIVVQAIMRCTICLYVRACAYGCLDNIIWVCAMYVYVLLHA